MLRQNQLLGCTCMAFGVGVLIGMFLESGFLCGLIGLGLVTLGMCILKRK